MKKGNPLIWNIVIQYLILASFQIDWIYWIKFFIKIQFGVMMLMLILKMIKMREIDSIKLNLIMINELSLSLIEWWSGSNNVTIWWSPPERLWDKGNQQHLKIALWNKFQATFNGDQNHVIEPQNFETNAIIINIAMKIKLQYKYLTVWWMKIRIIDRWEKYWIHTFTHTQHTIQNNWLKFY